MIATTEKTHTGTVLSKLSIGKGGFEDKLLRALGSLKALNFRQVAFMNREMENLPQNVAYKLLWLKTDLYFEKLHCDKTLERLAALVDVSYVTGWHVLDSEYLFTSKIRKDTSRRPYFRVPVDETSGNKVFHHKRMNCTKDRSLTVLTASSCALTLEYEGSEIVPVSKLWTERNDVDRPGIHPDFIVTKERPTAYYIQESPYGIGAAHVVGSVGRGLNFLPLDSIAVILTRTPEAFKKILFALHNKHAGENTERIYVGHLFTFYQQHGHSEAVNVKNNYIIL